MHQGTQAQLFYTGEVLGNVSGGLKRGAIYEGLLDVRLKLDLEKIAGWSQTSFFVQALYPHGSSLTQKYVGDRGVRSLSQVHWTCSHAFRVPRLTTDRRGGSWALRASP